MNRPLLFSAVLILVLAFFMIFRSQIDEVGNGEGESQDAVRSHNDVDGAATDSNEKTLSRRKPIKVTIEKIRSVGYQFSADQIKKRSAVGNVTLVTPEGAVLKSDYLSISSDGDYIYLQGEILLESKSDETSFRVKYSGESASAKIELGGESISFEGHAETTILTSKPDK